MTDPAYILLGFFVCTTGVLISFIPSFIAHKRGHTHPSVVTGMGIYGVVFAAVIGHQLPLLLWLGACVWAWVGSKARSIK